MGKEGEGEGKGERESTILAWAVCTIFHPPAIDEYFLCDVWLLCSFFFFIFEYLKHFCQPLLCMLQPVLSRTRTLLKIQNNWKPNCKRVNCGLQCSVVATLSNNWNGLSPADMFVAFQFIHTAA